MIRVGIAVEGEGDLRVIRPMVDARLRLMMGWDENEPLDPVRQWVGAAGSKHDWLKVSEAPKRAREAGLPLNAREFGGQPAKISSSCARCCSCSRNSSSMIRFTGSRLW